MGISPIEDLITVPHEAHFRLEILYALTAQSFRHDSARSASEDRYKKHQELCSLVAQDRRENGTEAFNHKSTNIKSTTGDTESDTDSDDGVDSQFY
jgi:hypothetical protein